MAERDARERDWDREPDTEPTRYGLLDGLSVMFAVAACFGIFFYLRGPAKNELHALFRLGVVGVGLVGLVVVMVLRLVQKRRP